MSGHTLRKSAGRRPTTAARAHPADGTIDVIDMTQVGRSPPPGKPAGSLDATERRQRTAMHMPPVHPTISLSRQDFSANDPVMSVVPVLHGVQFGFVNQFLGTGRAQDGEKSLNVEIRRTITLPIGVAVEIVFARRLDPVLRLILVLPGGLTVQCR